MTSTLIFDGSHPVLIVHMTDYDNSYFGFWELTPKFVKWILKKHEFVQDLEDTEINHVSYSSYFDASCVDNGELSETELELLYKKDFLVTPPFKMENPEYNPLDEVTLDFDGKYIRLSCYEHGGEGLLSSTYLPIEIFESLL